jgi:hypothetical protein
MASPLHGKVHHLSGPAIETRTRNLVPLTKHRWLLQTTALNSLVITARSLQPCQAAAVGGITPLLSPHVALLKQVHPERLALLQHCQSYSPVHHSLRWQTPWSVFQDGQQPTHDSSSTDLHPVTFRTRHCTSTTSTNACRTRVLTDPAGLNGLVPVGH